MIYIEAPNYIDIPNQTTPVLFLAGGISGVEDWQSRAVESLQKLDIVVCNPRRKNFEQFKNEAGFHESQKQIKWEFDHLEMANQILFWFSHETVQPIALFELGTRIRKNYDLFIGIHPDYPRRFDLITQLPLYGYNDYIIDNLSGLLQSVINYNKKYQLRPTF
jgi:hypothetical protein